MKSNIQNMKVLIKGSSMFPFVREGDEIEVECFETPKEIELLEIGDIALLNINKEWTLHRLHKQDGLTYTKGDWAVVKDSKSLAWGRAIKVNGRSISKTTNKFIHYLSSPIELDQNKGVRWLFRANLLILNKLTQVKQVLF